MLRYSVFKVPRGADNEVLSISIRNLYSLMAYRLYIVLLSYTNFLKKGDDKKLLLFSLKTKKVE
jgi:hypothetical protein